MGVCFRLYYKKLLLTSSVFIAAVLRIGVDLAGLLGGRMASAEGGSVPSMGRGVPSPAD